MHNFTAEERQRGARASRDARTRSKRQRQADLKEVYLGGLRNVRVLALKYGVSEKTIYRDLEEIRKGVTERITSTENLLNTA